MSDTDTEPIFPPDRFEALFGSGDIDPQELASISFSMNLNHLVTEDDTVMGVKREAAADTTMPYLDVPLEVQPSAPALPNAVPVLESWPGQHDFSVTVLTPVPAPSGRQLPYCFNGESTKLYTDIMVAVPFCFRAGVDAAAKDLRIRAMPVYSETHHLATPVRRCPNHREPTDESNVKGEAPVEHVMRAEHPLVNYDRTDDERCSITVPLERPEPGTDGVTILYKFGCMNTCTGGINRRRLSVIFTLEERSTGRALGRQAIEVKVCRCPHRDWRSDQKRRAEQTDGGSSKKRRRASEAPPPPPQQPGANTHGPWWVPAESERMYRLLMNYREFILNEMRAVREDLTPAALRRQPTAPTDGE